MSTYYYVVDVYGSIDPDVEGPYATEDERQAVAKAVHARQSDEDATFWLDVTVGADGKPVVEIGAYSGGFFAEYEDDAVPAIEYAVTGPDDTSGIPADQRVKVIVDLTAREWELFTQSMDCRATAVALNTAATEALNSSDPVTARAIFEEAQAGWSSYGASDTEPTTVFALMHIARYGEGQYRAR